ncbi:MAG: hypothetical protein ACXQTQ_04710 [Candidatus Hecatellaceae archaeon]
MVECPRCKSEDVELIKSWDVRPKSKRGKAIKVSIYQCRSCGNKFRKAVKLEEASAPNTSPAINMSQSIAGSVSEPQTVTVSDTHKESFFEKLKRSFHLF